MGERMTVVQISRGGLAEMSARLLRDAKGFVMPTLGNALLFLALDPTLAGVVGYNEFEEEPQVLRAPPVLNPGDDLAPGPYPRAVRPADCISVTTHIQRAHCPKMALRTVEEAIQAEAERSRFHPVRDWLATLRWDGVPRLDTWACKAFGAVDTPYVRAVAAKTLIAAVRRVREPGCKFDTMPVFEGQQGAGKSRTVRRLFGAEWFTDSMPPDLKSKDGMQALLGVWCIEFAEIEHLIRTDTETIKAFLSRPVERYRPSYGRGSVKRPRQCVFIGTTNATDYLRDTTGNRRIWPIACTHADEQWVAANREQLWAEAAQREASGEVLWLEEDAHTQAVSEQSDRITEDPWSEMIEDWLHENRYGVASADVTIPQLLKDALGLRADKIDKRGEMRVGVVLTRLGWTRVLMRRGGKPVRLWQRPKEPDG